MMKVVAFVILLFAFCCVGTAGIRVGITGIHVGTTRIHVDHACASNEAKSFPFCDEKLHMELRIQNLISSLIVEEKIGMMVNTAKEVSRLQIPGFQWWNEGLHGVANSPGVSFNGTIRSATSFPQPILTAASFNRTLFFQIAKVISTEARGLYNIGRKAGLTYWTPNINIFRDPRWGRGQETPGEDPLLTSVYAEYFVRGLQEHDDYLGNASSPTPGLLKVSACCKHFTAYDMDAWNGLVRYGFNAEVTQQDLEDTFNPPFKSCIQKGRASGLMCSYNSVNGIPSCANPELLTTIARDQWKFDGYIVSDCDAVHNIIVDHKYADPEHAIALTLKAGMDINCGDAFTNFTEGALQKKLITEEDLDEALTRSFRVQFRLGVFNDISGQEPYHLLGTKDVCSKDHQNLALSAVAQGIVLLKNNDNVLPLSHDSIQNLVVIGPNANDKSRTMIVNYAGDPCKYVTPLQGLMQHVASKNKKIKYLAGCNQTACESVDIMPVITAVSNADVTIIVVGLSQVQEMEALDRMSLQLPGQQEELVMEAARNSKGSVVLVVMSGGPVDITFAKNAKEIDSILWVGYPGQAGGQALAEILFGAINPGGKLPMTWYPETFTSVSMDVMNMRPAANYPGRTYRFYTGETVYEFGHGLSYSKFLHSFSNITLDAFSVPIVNFPSHVASGHLELDAKACSRSHYTMQIIVENTGDRAGDEVVLLYNSPPGKGEDGVILKQLIAFERVHVHSKSRVIVEFIVEPCFHLVTIGSHGESQLLRGVHTIFTNGGIELSLEVK